ncbi:serine/threonine protein kinase, variant 4 [Entomophthora muscae]|uniref:Serine/threonine protein kinase, variant 4 n=1 Tax=Entomophthora muscae TaxID=34485 RepID=A0ACC2U8R8_9FUNG|nr:serine/threonine protein kinase, variant 4 [Entomophthora muscae]
MTHKSYENTAQPSHVYQAPRSSREELDFLSPASDSLPEEIESHVPLITQPTQYNLAAHNLNSQDILSPTQPTTPTPRPIWGILEPADSNSSPIYLSFPKKAYTFGRSNKCDFTYQNPHLSGMHCSVVLVNENVNSHHGFIVGLIDHKSTNGTYLNEHKAIPEHAIALSDGDVIFMTKRDEGSAASFQEISFTFKVPIIDSLHAKYIVSSILGTGHFSEVRLARCRTTGNKVAVKLSKKELLEPRDILYTEREIQIMKKISHPFIASIIESFESDTSKALVMEYASDGDLFDYCNVTGKLSSAEFLMIFYQILSGIHFLHVNEILHRDVKPENVLIINKNTLHIKLSDFGLARFFDKRKTFSSLVGSPSYAAPEVNNFSASRSYTCACDMWSIGVMMYFCTFRKMPFSVTNRSVTLQDTAQIVGDWDSHPSTFRDLICRLLVFQPEGRLTALKALGHRHFVSLLTLQC